MRLAAAELNGLLSGGKVNKINQPSTDEVVLQIYSGRTYSIAVSANAQTARVCPTAAERPNPQVAPGFCMLLRKHLSGAVVEGVRNIGYERITVIDFEVKNDFRESVKKSLVCELMGKYSNIILVEEGKVLGTLRPAFGDISGARVLFSGMQYTLPPAQEKYEITDKTRVLGGFYNFNGNPATLVCSTVKGVSSRIAEEACHRFFKGSTSLNGREEEFYDFLLNFLEHPSLAPNVVRSGSASDFFPIDCETAEGEKTFFPTLLGAETAYFDRLESERLSRTKARAIREKLRAHEKKLNKKLQIISEKELSCADCDTNRIKGELLTAYQHSIPAGAESCELLNYYDENGGSIKIKLDPDLSANRNAQAYFKKYQKQKKTLAAIAPQKEEALSELDYLSDLYSELDRCEAADDYDILTEELRAAGFIRDRAPTKRKGEPQSMPKTFVLGGFCIRVGRNNLQNDRLTFSAARDDIWLHTKAFHSAHVIIETEGRPVPDDVLLAAAEICAYHSKAKGGDKVPVDYCFKKYVKKPPKAKPGGVIYTDFKTILVTPLPHDDLKK